MRRADATFAQPYRDALGERMTLFTEEERERLRAAQDDEADDGESPSVLSRAFPEVPVRYQVTSIAVSDEGLRGTSLAGTEIFHIPVDRLPETLTAATLKELAADTLGILQGSLTLWEGSEELVGAVAIHQGMFTLREAMVEDCRPVVCKRHDEGRREVMLGEGMVELQFNCFPEDGAIQAIGELRRYVTFEEPCWLIYTKKEVISYRFNSGDVLEALGYFPPSPVWKLPSGTRRWGGSRSDVWSLERLDLPQVRKLLDQHAALTNDRPIPRYQMIVDPNQFVNETPEGPVWVPCEFDISADGSVTLLGGPLSHVEPHLAQEVAGPVLQAAMPLLSKLRRPQLLLDRRRLQVVFKAQRILVPGRQADGSDSEYVGLWHVDGNREHVAAVVLYYYNVDEELKGGDMEFCGREPIDILGIGDCSNNFEEFGQRTLRAALRDEPDRKVTNRRVPIRQGTLLVFSNYQMAHRVLRMVNTGAREASRDFVALFVLDPAFPALKPAASVLAQSFLMDRALRSWGLSQSNATTVQEFTGDRQSSLQLKYRRNAMLKEQLRPTGEFCGGAQVVCAGNGCYTMIGWLHHLLDRDEDALEFMEEDGNWKGSKYLKALNLPPKKEGRGLSEVMSLGTAELDERLRTWEEQTEVFQDLVS